MANAQKDSWPGLSEIIQRSLRLETFRVCPEALAASVFSLTVSSLTLQLYPPGVCSLTEATFFGEWRGPKGEEPVRPWRCSSGGEGQAEAILVSDRPRG